MFDEKEILSQLPAGMATELVYLMYKSVIESTPFFEGLPRDVQTKLCLSMKPYPCLSGDVIMTEGEVGHEMFLIMQGTVAISKGGQVRVASHQSRVERELNLTAEFWHAGAWHSFGRFVFW